MEHCKESNLLVWALIVAHVQSNKQTIAHVYGHADPRDAGIVNALTLDEARRMASNIAKLTSLLGAMTKGGVT